MLCCTVLEHNLDFETNISYLLYIFHHKMWLFYYLKHFLRLDKLYIYHFFSHIDYNQVLKTWSWFCKMFHLLHTKDWSSSSSGAGLDWSISLQNSSICLNTSVALFLFTPQQIITELQSKGLTMLTPLLKIQIFVQTVEAVLPAVKISKTSTKFLEYPVSITIPKKDTV